VTIFGPPNVRKMKEKRNVKGLIRCLQYAKGDWFPIQEQAALALGILGDRMAVPSLVDLMSRYRYPSKSAIISLGLLQDERAVEPLLGLLLAPKEAAGVSYSDQLNKAHAAWALARLRAPQAIQALLDLLCDLGYRERTFWMIPSALRIIGRPSVQPTIDFLNSEACHGVWCKDPRQLAVGVLGGIRDDRSVEFLIDLLRSLNEGTLVDDSKCRADPDDEEREPGPLWYQVVEGLGCLGDARALEILAMTARNGTLRESWIRRNAGVRESAEIAAEAISTGRCGSIGTVEDVADLYLDGSVYYEEHKSMLTEYEGKTANALLKMMDSSKSDSDRGYREAYLHAVVALGKLGDSSATEPLLRRFADPGHYGYDARVFFAYEMSLARLGWSPR